MTMKRRGMLAVVGLTFALQAQAAGGGAGGAGGSGGGGAGGAGGAGSVIETPQVSDAKTREYEESLTPDEKKLFDEVLQLELARQGQVDAAKLASTRKQFLAFLAAAKPEVRKGAFAEMAASLPRMRRQADPAYVSDGERKAAAGLPAEARQEAAALASDDVEAFLAARRKMLLYGPAARPLVADVFRAVQSPVKQLRLRSLLNELESAGCEEQLIRTTEAAFARLAQLQKGRSDKLVAKLQVLLSRRVVDSRRHTAEDAYAGLCYFSFPKDAHGYNGAVSLQFSNNQKNAFDASMYGGQENKLKDLGAVDFDAVKSAPNADIVEEQWEESAPAVAGHVYMEHCLEARDKVDQCFKFKVIELKEDWVIVEWAPIPQEK